MKKIILSLVATLMIAATVMGCSSKESTSGDAKDVKTVDIVNKITTEIEVSKLGPVEGELAKEQYHLNLDDIEEFSIENGMINTGLESIAVVKAKDGKVDSVKASLEKVIEDKKAAAFYPGEAEAVESSELKIVGNYVGLFIIPDYEEGQKNSEKAASIFESELK
ncbi:MAG: DUF4358 domain-containing protein [Clostridium sp.]